MKEPNECTDEKLRNAILGSDAQRNEAFTCLYRNSGWRGWVINYVQTHRGNRQDGEDVFQETAMLFDRGIRERRFRKDAQLRTYFYGIAKWVWFNRQRKTKRYTGPPPEPLDLGGIDVEAWLLKEERKQRVWEIIGHLTDMCKKVLPLYMLSWTNKEIARELGLSSPELTNKYVHRCREQFRKFIDKHGWL